MHLNKKKGKETIIALYKLFLLLLYQELQQTMPWAPLVVLLNMCLSWDAII